MPVKPINRKPGNWQSSTPLRPPRKSYMGKQPFSLYILRKTNGVKNTASFSFAWNQIQRIEPPGNPSRLPTAANSHQIPILNSSLNPGQSEPNTHDTQLTNCRTKPSAPGVQFQDQNKAGENHHRIFPHIIYMYPPSKFHPPTTLTTRNSLIAAHNPNSNHRVLPEPKSFTPNYPQVIILSNSQNSSSKIIFTLPALAVNYQLNPLWSPFLCGGSWFRCELVSLWMGYWLMVHGPPKLWGQADGWWSVVTATLMYPAVFPFVGIVEFLGLFCREKVPLRLP